MSFLAKLFSKKAKSRFKRSNTDPDNSDSEAGDDDLVDPNCVTVRTRRPGCDFGTANASVDHDSRSSVASISADVVDPTAKSKYRNLRPVHRGRGCTLMSATERASKQQVIMKAYPKHSLEGDVLERLENEAGTLREVAGLRGIVRLLNMLDDDDTRYVVLEHCPGVTLIELITNNQGRLPESFCAVEVAIPLLQAVAALHSHGCVHRNLKPEHIICGPACSVKVIDFTAAANKAVRCLNCRMGAPEYSAPEVLAKPTAAEVFHKVLYNGMAEEELPQYNEKADVFSLGTILFEALTGRQPFQAESTDVVDLLLVQQTKLHDSSGPGGVPAFLTQDGLSPEAQSFLAAALALQPSKRSSAEELLQHPWLAAAMPAFYARRAQARVRRSISLDDGRLSQGGSLTGQRSARHSNCSPGKPAGLRNSTSARANASGSAVAGVLPTLAGVLPTLAGRA